MANNRLYLRCNKCGDEMFLGKDFGCGFYWMDYSRQGIHLEDGLNKFFGDHIYCSKEKQLHGDEDRPQIKPVGYKPGDFSLVYEDYPEDCQEDEEDGLNVMESLTDAVPVVRCKGCKHKEDEEPGMIYCPNQICGWVRQDFFSVLMEKKGGIDNGR